MTSVSVGEQCAQCGQVQGYATALEHLIQDYLWALQDTACGIEEHDSLVHEALERLTRAVGA